VVAHHPAAIASWRSWVARILSHHVKHVTEVETDGMYPKHHGLFMRKRRHRLGLKEEVGEGAARVEVQSHNAVTR